MNEEVRLVGNGEHEEDIWQYSLRPKLFNEYVGQEEAKGNLNVYIQAAKQRGEALDHVLLYGPPGLGKTTLAGIIANELGVNFRITSGPAIEKSGARGLRPRLPRGYLRHVLAAHRRTGPRSQPGRHDLPDLHAQVQGRRDDHHRAVALGSVPRHQGPRGN